jgi:hypothetical protein
VLVLLTGVIYEVRPWDGLRWRDIHYKFHEDLFGHLGNVKGFSVGAPSERILVCMNVWGVGLLGPRTATYSRLSWDRLMWHDIHNKCHGHRLKHSSNIWNITSEIWEATVMVLLKRRICYVCQWHGLSSTIYIPGFMYIEIGIQIILRFCLRNLRGLNVGITDGRNLWCTPLRWPRVAWYIYIPSFMKIGWGVQAILRLCLRNLRGFNVGITDGRDLWITPLRLGQMPWYTHPVTFRLVELFRS